MASTQEKVKDYVAAIKKENDPQKLSAIHKKATEDFEKGQKKDATKTTKRHQAAFNKAGNLIKALEALDEATQGKIKVVSKGMGGSYGEDVEIEMNVPGYPRNLTLYAGYGHIMNGRSSTDAQSFYIRGIQNRFSVKRAVKYVVREAHRNGMI